MMDMRLASIMVVLGAIALARGGVPSLAAPTDGPKVSHEECLKRVVAYVSQIPIDDEIMARLVDARQYYHQHLCPFSYQIPKAPMWCDKFSDALKAIDTHVTFYHDRTVMVKSEYENAMDLFKESEEVRIRMEADFACRGARLAGYASREEKFFDAVVGKTE